MSKPEYYPSLRGRFGDWAFYSVLMTLGQVAERVSFAKEIHTSERLSQMIQRELEGDRSSKIADYLRTNEDRFFNSLVIAVYEGEPEWLQFDNVRPVHEEFEPRDLTDTAKYSLGYLSLRGDEKLFALDGQHRLAGIKQAVTTNAEILDEEVSVLFVAHHNDTGGLKRTRKLFTTLNKTAKPVKRSEIIALDESDVMAITVRRLVEEHPFFTGNRILFRAQANLPRYDTEHLTTIGNLYDVLSILYSKVITLSDGRRETLEQLRFYRPSDESLSFYYDWTSQLFVMLGDAFPEFGEYLSGKNDEATLQRYRNGGGHLLFRPVGLLIICEVLTELVKTKSLEEAIQLCTLIPVQLTDAPYAGVIYHAGTDLMDPGNRPTARNLLLYMLGVLKKADALQRLQRRYAELLEVDPSAVDLPALLV